MKAKSTFLVRNVLPSRTWAPGSPNDDGPGLPMATQGGNISPDRRIIRWMSVYVSGPGGVWIVSSEGKHLGTIRGPEYPHNMAWGDDDGRTLYLTAITGLYCIRLIIPGVRP
jgi:gluconolactonase